VPVPPYIWAPGPEYAVVVVSAVVVVCVVVVSVVVVVCVVVVSAVVVVCVVVVSAEFPKWIYKFGLVCKKDCQKAPNTAINTVFT
jgi:hypothetical protein